MVAHGCPLFACCLSIQRIAIRIAMLSQSEALEEPVAPAAAAAVAAPVRSRSLIVASNESFLDEFIRDHPDCLSWRWNDEKVQGLEAAAAEYSKKHGIATQGVENLKAGLKKRRQPA